MSKTEKITSLALFIIVFVIYAYCAPSTISFWDSPEFITTSNNLQASHPPGSPLYSIFCAFVLLFFPATKAAVISNLVSSFFGALTVSVVFHITYFISDKISNYPTNLISIFSGLLGALSLGFCTSFWIASTEAEVYTLSFFLLSILIYIALKWEATTSKKLEYKLQLLFTLLLGLALGVHLITLSVIIPLSILFTKKKYGLTFKTFSLSVISSTLLFFFIYSFFIQGLIKLAAKLDFLLVNSFGLFMNSGIILTLTFLVLFIGFLLVFSYKKNKFILYHTTLASVFFLIGFSSYLMPLVRSNGESLVANGTYNSHRLLDYIKGNQFGISNIPLIKGYTYNAPLNTSNPFSNIDPIYNYDTASKKYQLAHNGKFKTVNHPSEFSMFFPRLYDSKSSELYKAWIPIKGEEILYPVNDKEERFIKPTFKENLHFFFHYQVYWLNLRYLFWNFIGRQNNHHGLGYVEQGNWISGFNFIDKKLIGDKNFIPSYYKNDKTNDTYYFIPFVLGILGLFTLLKNKPYFWVTLLTFLAFGIGITLYINPPPTSLLVRERDYIFIGSFVVFSVWIGLSMNFIYSLLSKLLNKENIITLTGFILLLLAPIQMLSKGWNNHQRKQDDFAYKLAKSYLDSCPLQSILITNGDNMSFPLWYLQYVEKYRTDIRVINYDQLNLDNNINNLSKQILTSKPIKIDLKEKLYLNGIDKLVPFNEDTKQPVELDLLFAFLNNDKTKINWNGQMKNYVPSQIFKYNISNRRQIEDSLISKKYYSSTPTNQITWQLPKTFYGLNDLVVLNIIQNNFDSRKILFLDNSKKNHFVGLEKFLIKKGLVYELSGIKRNGEKLNPKIIDTKETYKILIEDSPFTNINNSAFISYENKLYSETILRQNYYFLAQALFEENQIDKAYKTLKTCENIFPNRLIPYKQYAFGIGKLYLRMGFKKEGTIICNTAISNIYNELKWITSFNPQNPIINVRHAEKKYRMLLQMLKQTETLKLNAIPKTELATFTKSFTIWKKTNWPY
ncbi:glycosyltransferase family 117 protein [Pseudofulvibacter geojedonensis]|uniref:DUF2723 domain-containing protein n=1 Tax=Pseudofulvibacter geojedonensis TaxID=1123758 RepID=A0ABW3HZY8_9FLAO